MTEAFQRYICDIHTYGICAATFLHHYRNELTKRYDRMNESIEVDPMFAFPSTVCQAPVFTTAVINATQNFSVSNSTHSACTKPMTDLSETILTKEPYLLTAEDFDISDLEVKKHQPTKTSIAKYKYQCLQCGKSYLSTDSVKKHWRNKHTRIYIRKGHREDYCKRIFMGEKEM